ncbi:MAG: type VII toxin-antitoxin system HepT family RNase toxin [Candidatus Njordarchaeales archaeon]
MISEKRLKRYYEKIAHAEKRISQINEWIAGYTEKDFVNDEKTKLAVYKAFQEAVESIMDIIAMMCKDEGIPPRDDYMNIEALHEAGLINEALREKLVEANGLRNRLVHHYNKLSDEKAFQSILELLDSLLKTLDGVREWITEKLEK